MISAGARYATLQRPCTVTIQPERASASSVTTGRRGPSGPLKGVPADDDLHGYPPDRTRDRETPEKGGSEVETVPFAEPGKGQGAKGGILSPESG